MAETSREITGLGFFKLGALLADVPKTINYLQNYGVIPDGTRKNCAFCHAQDSVALHKNAKGHVPFLFRCSKCRKGISAATNTWFEKGRITMKQSLGLIYSWRFPMILENNEVCIWFYINNSLLAILSYLRMFLSEFTVSVHFL